LVDPDAVEGALGVESVERTIELLRGGAGEAQLAARSPNGVNRWRVSSSSLRASWRTARGVESATGDQKDVSRDPGGELGAFSLINSVGRRRPSPRGMTMPNASSERR
jgi:hypothetical protein